MVWRSTLGDISPDDAETPADFTALLLKLHVRGDMSYEQLASKTVELDTCGHSGTAPALPRVQPVVRAARAGRQAGGHKNGYSTSGIQAALRRKTLPDWRMVDLILRAYGAPEPVRRRWDAAWTRLTDQEMSASPSTSELVRQAESLAKELAEARRTAEDLKERELLLEQELAKETKRRQVLEDEILMLRQNLAAAEQRADKLAGELRARLGSKQREQSAVVVHITELDTELRHIVDQRQVAEVQYEKLERQIAHLDNVSASLDGLFELHYRRAEHERHNREKAELANETLEKRLKVAEQLLGEYQSQSREETVTSQRGDVAVPINEDVFVQFTASAKDFGNEQTVSLLFSWYCQSCDCGGERSSLVLCPHCVGPVDRSYRKQIYFLLPASQCYGKTIRLLNRGYQDMPGAPAGDVRVMVVP
jgi:hypothetical protein